MTPELEATLARVDDQIAWYDRKSGVNQKRHLWSAGVVIVLGAAIPITAWLFPNVVPAILGAIVAVVTGFNYVCQWEFNWINYRSTCEKLKHERHLFDAKAGPYADAANPQRLLAERTEATVSTEHASWITINDQRHGHRLEPPL